MQKNNTSLTKNRGQYFTPERIADFMVGLITKGHDATILEPCAGKGVFLTSLQKAGFNSFKAYEIDKGLPNLSQALIDYQDFLKVPATGKYEVVIGNPPYVRWRNILPEVREFFETNSEWKEKMNGLTDLLYAFIYKCIDELEEGGELIFITPSFWTQTTHAGKLRRYLLQRGHISLLITFDEIRIFKGVSSSIIIFKYVKKRDNLPMKVVRITGKENLSQQMIDKLREILLRLDSETQIQEGLFEGYPQSQFTNGQSWHPLSPKDDAIIKRIESGCTFSPLFEVQTKTQQTKARLSELFDWESLEETGNLKQPRHKVVFAGKQYYLLELHSGLPRVVRLGDVMNIGNGMVSGCDKAFRATESADPSSIKKIISVVKSKDLRRYYYTTTTQYWFLDDVQTEAELRRYPTIFNNLSAYSNVLRERYDYQRGIPWWHWAFPRNKSLLENNVKKIFVPCKERIDKKGFVRFSYAEGSLYAAQDVTVLVKKLIFREDTKFFVGLLNSRAIFTWIRHKGLRRGGVVEFSEKPLSRIPIRLIDWTNPTEIWAHNRLVELVEKIIETCNPPIYQEEIDQIVNKLYGLT